MALSSLHCDIPAFSCVNFAIELLSLSVDVVANMLCSVQEDLGLLNLQKGLSVGDINSPSVT